MLKQGGFTLIEALVALAILAFGLMGSAALQLKALHSATRSYQHSVATLAAVDAQERLWEARKNSLCSEIESKIETGWQNHWQSDKPSNPLRNAKQLDISDDNDDCTYTITVQLDDEGDDGYGKVEYIVRLPK